MSVPLELFVETWKTAFAKILLQLGAKDAVTPDADPSALPLAAPGNSSALGVRFSGGGCLKGQLQWSTTKPVALQLAQLLVNEPVDPSVEFSDTHLDGFLEFTRQVAGEVAIAWKHAQGAPVELSYQSETAEPFATQAAAGLQLDCDKCKGLSVRLDLDSEMLIAVSAPREPEAAPADPSTAPASQSEAEVESAVRSNLPTNLDLILDVQLDATIRFGEREMLLKNVFALMPGAVVELDRLVNEPAELLVAGRLVATGEVVVVDGNFGLRIKEVLAPAQRAIAQSLS